MDYPASKEDLISHAKQNGADENAISALEALADEEYESPTDVSEAIGDQE